MDSNWIFDIQAAICGELMTLFIRRCVFNLSPLVEVSAAQLHLGHYNSKYKLVVDPHKEDTIKSGFENVSRWLIVADILRGTQFTDKRY